MPEFRAEGTEDSVGEVEFVAGIAAMSASGGYGPIKAAADRARILSLGEDRIGTTATNSSGYRRRTSALRSAA
jgi:hypothetical protein